MQTLKTNTEILIVGAGPTGLALAAELARRGIDAVIIDQQPAGANTSRACVVHARTLEVLEPLGETADLLALGIKVPIFRIRDRDRTLITIDFAEIDSPYPFTLMCSQDKIERTLLGHLRKSGGDVVRPCRLVSCGPSGASIEAKVEIGGAVQAIAAKWLVGCDGMHSTVREMSGIEFAGAAYQQSFVLADVRMDWPLSRQEVTLFYAAEGLVVVAPLPDDHFRIVATVDQAPDLPSAEYIQALLDQRGPAINPARIRDVVWNSRFHIHHRVAEHLRKGRTLLCGDAAHVHSPAGGQGMNTGIQDGISLGDALARTLADGDETRLQTWVSERHRIASDVVRMTDRLTRIATIKSRAGQHLRNVAVTLAGQVPSVRAALARTLAELDAR